MTEGEEGNKCKKWCLTCLKCIEFGSFGKKEEQTEEEKELYRKERKIRWIVAICFFVLGVTNNFGYVAYNAGASDIISETDTKNETEAQNTTNTNPRNCLSKSPGVILMAEILPGFVIKLLASFTPLYLHLRVGIIVACQLASFILVAITKKFYVAIIGTVLMSISSELGEATYLQYSTLYGYKYAVTGWSSGTGAAGVLGAVGVTVLIKSTSYVIAFLSMCVIPVLMLVVYIFMPKPKQKSVTLDKKEKRNPCEGCTRKIKMLPSIWLYLVPLAGIYFFEYCINSGLFFVLTYENLKWSNNDYYRYYNICYQVGVFMSRSSLLCVRIKYVWMMCVLQLINFIFFFLDACYGLLPSFYICCFIIIYEGLLGGLGYVNNYNNIQVELEGEKKEFCTSISTLVNSIFIFLAGLAAIPVFNYVCSFPPYTRHIWF